MVGNERARLIYLAFHKYGFSIAQCAEMYKVAHADAEAVIVRRNYREATAVLASQYGPEFKSMSIAS